MSNINIKKIDENRYRLQGVEQLGGRYGMKLNIYLNAMKDTSIVRNTDSVDIVYVLPDQHVIAKSLRNVVEFLESCRASVDTDTATALVLSEQERFEQCFASRVESLKAIKAEDASVKAGYEKFCAFCDDVLKIGLRDYQYKSAFLLSAGQGGFDFSVPGAGKTIIAYATYAFMKHEQIVDNI